MTDEKDIHAGEQDADKVTTDDDNDDDNEGVVEVDVDALQQELAKEKADREKWENRYKSAKKKEATQPKEENKNEIKEVDVESIVERQLTAIQEKKDFISKYGEEVFTEIKKIKEKHPTLSLEDAYKISPIALDQASKEDPASFSMWGRANEKAIMDSKSITLEQYVALPQAQYSLMKDRIAKGEVTLKK